MEDLTITGAYLAEVLYREIGLSRNDATSLVEGILEEIVIALTRGDMVKLTSFGNFSVKQKRLRMGRNPKSGKEVPILPRKVLVFRASQILKDRINHRPAGTTGQDRGDCGRSVDAAGRALAEEGRDPQDSAP